MVRVGVVAANSYGRKHFYKDFEGGIWLRIDAGNGTKSFEAFPWLGFA